MAGWVPTVVAIAAFAYFGESEWIAGGVALASLTGYLDDRGKSIGREMTWRVKGGMLTAATALAASSEAAVMPRAAQAERRASAAAWAAGSEERPHLSWQATMPSPSAGSATSPLWGQVHRATHSSGGRK